MITIFFYYGLAFIVMGCIIFMMPKKRDFLNLSGDIWLVGLFGLVHGLNEWIDLFILRGRPFDIQALKIIGGLLLPISFIFLILFAIRVILREKPGFNWLRHLWIFCLLAWVIAYVLSRGFLISGIIARYLICLPGTFLTAFALSLAYSKLNKAQLPRIVSLSTAASMLTFIVYGILSGLVVPKADFLLASVINYPNFLNLFGFPVQFFRMLCAIVLTLGFFGMVGLFYYEKEKGSYRSAISIGQKLTWGFLTVAVLIGVVGYISVNTNQKALQKAIGESSVLLARETLDKIDRNIYNRIEGLQAYSKDLLLQEALIESNQEFENLGNIQAYIAEKDKEWTSAPKKETTPFMREIINNKLSQELVEKIEFYEEKYGYKVFGRISVANKYGANFAQTQKTTDYRHDDKECWQNVKKDGLYVGDVKYDESLDIYAIDICIRINDENGNFLGVMKVVLNIEGSIDIVKELGLREGEEYAEHKAHGHKAHTGTNSKLFTKDGKIIYSTEEFEIFQDLYEWLISKFKKVTDPGHKHYFVGPGDMPGEEEEELFAHAHSKGYKEYKGLGWILVIEHKTEEIFAPVAKLRNLLLGISVCIMIIAILVGFFIARSISQPIAKLKDAAGEIGEGNLDTKIEIKSKDEIGFLGNTFNKMTENLSKSRKELTAAKDYTDNIIKSMIDTLIVVDSDARIKTINKATTELLGYTEDELIGKPVGMIFAEEEEEEMPFKGTRMKKLIEEGSIRNYDMTYKTKSGEKIPVTFSGSVMRDKEGELIGIVGIARDMREIKKRIVELERFRKATINREFRMEELRKEIERLKGKG